MIVHTDQTEPPRLAAVPDGSLLPDDSESRLLKKTNDFAESQARSLAISIMIDKPGRLVTPANEAPIRVLCAGQPARPAERGLTGLMTIFSLPRDQSVVCCDFGRGERAPVDGHLVDPALEAREAVAPPADEDLLDVG